MKESSKLTAGLNWRTTMKASLSAWYRTMPTLECAFTMSQRRCFPEANAPLIQPMSNYSCLLGIFSGLRAALIKLPTGDLTIGWTLGTCLVIEWCQPAQLAHLLSWLLHSSYQGDPPRSQLTAIRQQDKGLTNPFELGSERLW
jgi:hypothetical protein